MAPDWNSYAREILSKCQWVTWIFQWLLRQERAAGLRLYVEGCDQKKKKEKERIMIFHAEGNPEPEFMFFYAETLISS